MTDENIIDQKAIADEYRNIWETLSKIDVSKHVEKKNGLSYLSWAWAWGVLMEHFPHAEYSFSSPELHQDGTVTIHCDVMIGNCLRTMWLPVMDYKNNAIKNPDARKISDTKMRTFVKCLAMFGLGHYIYAGEDINPSTESESVAQLSKEELNTLSEPPEPKKKKPVPTKSGPNDIPTEEGAAEVVGKLLEFANKFCADEAGLVGFWKENKKIIDILDSNYPKQYEVLKQGFIQLKAKVGGNANV
jgi:hypothetical protein